MTIIGTVTLPSLDAIMQIKDPNRRVEELVNTLGILIKNLSELNGYINSKNIKAKSITADRLIVETLSSITADIGHVISGIIESVEIYGSLIATSKTGYPRTEMSSTDQHFQASMSENQYISMSSYEPSPGSPYFTWRDNSNFVETFLRAGLFTMNSIAAMKISAPLHDLSLLGANIYFGATIGDIVFLSWSIIVNDSTGQSLQSAFNSKADSFSGYSGSFATGDGRTASVSNGIITSVV